MPSADSPAPPAANALLEPDHRRALLTLARASITHGLETGRPAEVVLDKQPPALCVPRAAFVTLHRDRELRGCIGHLEAVHPLVIDVAENAFAAAFRDPRFPPVSVPELGLLRISLSVLTPAEPIGFGSEAELLAALEPGVDGVILGEDGRRGTFLPSVWEQLPRREDFLRGLKHKAGLSADHWSERIRAWRYRTESFGE
jgi:AmmeMemoRadiSam system protein A